MSRVTKWIPITNLKMLRRMGKLIEELLELGIVAVRCIIQGIDEVDPGSGKTNRQRLMDEMADVEAQLVVTSHWLFADTATMEYMGARTNEKIGYMRQWEAMFTPGEDERVVTIDKDELAALRDKAWRYDELCK